MSGSSSDHAAYGGSGGMSTERTNTSMSAGASTYTAGSGGADETVLFNDNIDVTFSDDVDAGRTQSLHVLLQFQGTLGGTPRLHLELTSQTDAQFLLLVSMTDHEFNTVKAQTKYTRSFAEWARAWADRLTAIKNGGSAFVAELSRGQGATSRATPAVASQLEIWHIDNGLRALHLHLRLAPASDQQIKDYLARCWKVEQETADTQRRVIAQKDDVIRHLQLQNSDLVQQVHLLGVQASKAATAAAQEHQHELEALKAAEEDKRAHQSEQYESRLSILQRDLDAQAAALAERKAENARLATTVSELERNVAQLDKQLTEAVGKVAARDARVRDLEQDYAAARETIFNLESGKTHVEGSYNEIRVMSARMEEQLQQKEAMYQDTVRKLEAVEADKTKAQQAYLAQEARWAKYKQTVELEMSKGNTVIATVTKERDKYRRDSKEARRALVKQEAELRNSLLMIEKLRTNIARLEEVCTRDETERRSLQQRLQDAMHQNEKLQEAIQLKDQTITELGQQQLSRDMGFSVSGGSSLLQAKARHLASNTMDMSGPSFSRFHDDSSLHLGAGFGAGHSGRLNIFESAPLDTSAAGLAAAAPSSASISALGLRTRSVEAAHTLDLEEMIDSDAPSMFVAEHS